MHVLNDKLSVICELVKERPYGTISSREIPGFKTTLAEIICVDHSPYLWCIFHQSFSLRHLESFPVKLKFLDNRRGLFVRVDGTANIEQQEIYIPEDQQDSRQIKAFVKVEVIQVVQLTKQNGELVMIK